METSLPFLLTWTYSVKVQKWDGSQSAHANSITGYAFPSKPSLELSFLDNLLLVSVDCPTWTSWKCSRPLTEIFHGSASKRGIACSPATCWEQTSKHQHSNSKFQEITSRRFSSGPSSNEQTNWTNKCSFDTIYFSGFSTHFNPVDPGSSWKTSRSNVAASLSSAPRISGATSRTVT